MGIFASGESCCLWSRNWKDGDKNIQMDILVAKEKEKWGKMLVYDLYTRAMPGPSQVARYIYSVDVCVLQYSVIVVLYRSTLYKYTDKKTVCFNVCSDFAIIQNIQSFWKYTI